MTHISRMWIAAASTALALMSPRTTSAGTAQIILSITGCEAAGVRADCLFELVRVELAPREVVPDLGAPGSGAARVSVRLCEGSANRAAIALETGGTFRTLRQLDLSDVVNNLRERTIALALAELVINASSEPPAPAGNNPAATQGDTANVEAPSSGPDGNKSHEAIFRASAIPPLRTPFKTLGRSDRAQMSVWRINGGIAQRAFFSPQTMLFGPWASIESHRWSGELQLLTSAKHGPQGEIHLYDANVAATYEVASYRSIFLLRLRIETGGAWGTATGYDLTRFEAHRQWATKLGLAIEFAYRISVLRNFGFHLHLQSGVARGLVAAVDGVEVATTKGFFAGAGLGLAYLKPN